MPILAIFAIVSAGCAASVKRHTFPVNEGYLLPQESALPYVIAHLPGASKDGILLYAREGGWVRQKTLGYKYEHKKHFPYKGLYVTIRQYNPPPSESEGNPFALTISTDPDIEGSEGKITYWFTDLERTKEIAMALVSLGARPTS